MTRRTIRFAAVGAALALGLTACGGGGDEGDDGATGGGGTVDPDEEITLTVTWWGNDDRADRYNQAIELFNEEYPNITINPNFSAWPDYWTARATEAAGSALPDVMQMDLAYISQFGSRGQLLDLDPYIGGELDVSGMPESLLAAGQLEAGTVGIPQSTNTLALFYNPAVVTQLGIEPPANDLTWDDYDAWITQAAEAGAGLDPVLYGSGDYTGVFWLFIQHLVQEGNEVFTADGEIAFTEDDMKEWLNRTTDLRADGSLFPTERTVQLAPLGGFTVNEVASEFSWDNFLAGYLADSGAESIEMLPMPLGSSGERGMFQKPSMLLSAGSNTEHPEAAAAFIDFITNDPAVGAIFGTSRGVPATESARSELSAEGTDAQVIAYEESVADDITESVPTLPEGFGSIEATWLRLAEELGYGQITVDEFVEQWFAEAESALA
ncbi:carbohydrate ABC transporter substrate-binding protein [Occultella glacieicola]|uniref:Carbohydrate ABC transporter substrate-binding protein n=1 Tax=Occultella glacieicola TaxID=2518684 RepID=A0ABY2E5Z7_9MICO|nr:ABC transporter substrate-binding protein [Occultella glacieicola]TDE91648.1 carbohydrate ABC transporter substrate-binding protein [Occultella glacieicola]